MIINHNINSIYVQRQLLMHQNKVSKSIEKLSSGLKINSAKDDPIGLFVSEKMRSQIQGLKTASQNIQLGVNLLNTTETWLDQVNVILQKLRQISIQTASGIYTDEDRSQVKVEANELISEIDRISSSAEYNKMKLLQGNFKSIISSNPGEVNSTNPAPIASDSNQKSDSINMHIGPNMNENIKILVDKISAFTLGLKESEASDAKLSIEFDTDTKSNESIGKIDSAIQTINSLKSKLGAQSERIEIVLNSVLGNIENFQSAESIIRDTNTAEEITNYIQKKVLSDTAAIMLAQSNIQPHLALKLLNSST